MMLPLEKRTNRLLAIHMRIISFEYAKYILQIITQEGKTFLSNETDNTMLPIFDVDRSNKEFSKFLTTTSETDVKFILIKINKNNFTNNLEKIEEFRVNLGELVLFCDDMSKARIKNYPLIIFEFTEGFFTTRDLYVNNTFNYQLEAFNSNNLQNFTLTKSLTLNNSNAFKTENTNLKNQPSNSNRNLQNSFINIFNKREIKFSNLNEKFKQYEFFDKQLKVLSGDKSEKIKILNLKLESTNEALSNFYKKYEMTINIDKMRKEIYQLQEKIFTYENYIDSIKKLISQKQSDLHISSSIFYLNRENYKDKVESIEKNYKKIEKYKIMYNSFKNKKLIEVSYFFFNKFCLKFYYVPQFYNQIFDVNSKLSRYQYYEKNSKELSVMMGNVANLINYVSKLFNIPLKYPFFINGSRFVPLYSIAKNEDRNVKFEQATFYVQENLNEILKYFNIRDEESDIQFITENNTHKLSYNYSQSLLRRNLFSDFLKLNLFLVKKVSKNKLYED